MNDLAHDDAKRALRGLMRARRAAAAGDSTGLVAALLALDLPQGAAIGGIWPLGEEPDLSSAWHRLYERGHALLLPETPPRGMPLLFRHWRPGALLRPGRFGTHHPAGAPGVPDIVFVPLLAWDRRGGRLGYGGGYYDRTLATLPHARAIGIGFAFQEVDSVPVGPYDIRLRSVLTENGLVGTEG